MPGRHVLRRPSHPRHWALVLFLMLGARLDAQTGLTGGAVKGTVRDPAGDALGDVAVSFVGQGTGLGG